MTHATEVLVASTPQDAEAVQTVRRHHAELASGLEARVEALQAAVEAGGDHVRVQAARADLVAFCQRELIPHAQAEEDTLYRAAAQLPALRLLVGVMASEHVEMGSLVSAVASATTGARAAAAAAGVAALFRPHLAAENDVLLPRLAADPAISLADLLYELHREVEVRSRAAAARDVTGSAAGSAVPDAAGAAGPGASPGSCGCGGADDAAPELDVRAIPHSIRHAVVFGAFDAVPSGKSLVLVAPHDPKPLLHQLAERTPGELGIAYLERGPQLWRLKLTK